MMSLQMQALGITNSLAFPMVFKAALELGVLDTIVAIDDGVWLSSSEIAFGLPTKPTNPEAPILLDRMLRLLVGHSILKCRIVETGENDLTGKTQRVYAAEPVCTFFLNRGVKSGSLTSLFMLLQSQVFFKTWTHLKDVILQEEKDAFSSAHDMRLFEYIGLDEQFAVDIGGGLGTILNLVTSKYPQIKGVEHVSGDMFIGVPKEDAIFMKEKGKVIIVDMVTPSEPKSDDLFSNIVFGMDMLMLTQCSGGKERSFSQFEALASASGFLKCEISALAYTYSVIEFHK
ncbi:unnamed protein product [Arabidopsis arenosa]|uniref:Uncharacterized protein n=1 Tax=Arabidopsis arenosa TaxID=38785 RepID=A0A8S2AUN4_ARAAE|nr:unnamed protein product [Arabidopsis arenosa]